MIQDGHLLPPVDVKMHHFRLYAFITNSRPEWGIANGQGATLTMVTGYFKYTEAYRRKMKRY